MRPFTFKNAAAAASVAIASFAGTTAYAANVDTALSLVIDISGSISTSEYNAQMDGYANAFRDATVQAGILDTGNGDLGSIAVNVIQYGFSSAEQVGFTVLDSIASINAFADTLDNLARDNSLSSSTGIANGIDVAVATLGTWLAPASGNTATRSVIDVSGDGTENVTNVAGLQAARDAALGAGHVINGVTIGGSASLLNFYTDNVIGGPGSFAISSSGFLDFERAIKVKLNAEITGTPPQVPVPAGILLMGTALAGFGVMRRRKKAA